MNRLDFIAKYSKKEYIGDGVYIKFDGYHFILSTPRENGWHEIGLEPPVFENLIKYRAQLYSDHENIIESTEKSYEQDAKELDDAQRYRDHQLDK